MTTRKRIQEFAVDKAIREARESHHLINTDPESCRNPALSARLDITNGESRVLDDMGDLVASLPTMEEITPAAIEQEGRIREQLRHEARYRRMYLMERKYHLALQALDELEYQIQSGGNAKDLAVNAAQARLLIKDYFNLTREEYGEKESPILAQQQVNIVQRVIIQAPGEQPINGRIIDGEVVE